MSLRDRYNNSTLQKLYAWRYHAPLAAICAALLVSRFHVASWLLPQCSLAILGGLTSPITAQQYSDVNFWGGQVLGTIIVVFLTFTALSNRDWQSAFFDALFATPAAKLVARHFFLQSLEDAVFLFTIRQVVVLSSWLLVPPIPTVIAAHESGLFSLLRRVVEGKLCVMMYVTSSLLWYGLIVGLFQRPLDPLGRTTVTAAVRGLVHVTIAVMRIYPVINASAGVPLLPFLIVLFTRYPLVAIALGWAAVEPAEALGRRIRRVHGASTLAPLLAINIVNVVATLWSNAAGRRIGLLMLADVGGAPWPASSLSNAYDAAAAAAASPLPSGWPPTSTLVNALAMACLCGACAIVVSAYHHALYALYLGSPLFLCEWDVPTVDSVRFTRGGRVVDEVWSLLRSVLGPAAAASAAAVPAPRLDLNSANNGLGGGDGDDYDAALSRRNMGNNTPTSSSGAAAAAVGRDNPRASPDNITMSTSTPRAVDSPAAAAAAGSGTLLDIVGKALEVAVSLHTLTHGEDDFVVLIRARAWVRNPTDHPLILEPATITAEAALGSATSTAAAAGAPAGGSRSRRDRGAGTSLLHQLTAGLFGGGDASNHSGGGGGRSHRIASITLGRVIVPPAHRSSSSGGNSSNATTTSTFSGTEGAALHMLSSTAGTALEPTPSSSPLQSLSTSSASTFSSSDDLFGDHGHDGAVEVNLRLRVTLHVDAAVTVGAHLLSKGVGSLARFTSFLSVPSSLGGFSGITSTPSHGGRSSSSGLFTFRIPLLTWVHGQWTGIGAFDPSRFTDAAVNVQGIIRQRRRLAHWAAAVSERRTRGLLMLLQQPPQPSGSGNFNLGATGSHHPHLSSSARRDLYKLLALLSEINRRGNVAAAASAELLAASAAAAAAVATGSAVDAGRLHPTAAASLRQRERDGTPHSRGDTTVVPHLRQSPAGFYSPVSAAVTWLLGFKSPQLQQQQRQHLDPGQAWRPSPPSSAAARAAGDGRHTARGGGGGGHFGDGRDHDDEDENDDFARGSSVYDNAESELDAAPQPGNSRTTTSSTLRPAPQLQLGRGARRRRGARELDLTSGVRSAPQQLMQELPMLLQALYLVCAIHRDVSATAAAAAATMATADSRSTHAGGAGGGGALQSQQRGTPPSDIASNGEAAIASTTSSAATTAIAAGAVIAASRPSGSYAPPTATTAATMSAPMNNATSAPMPQELGIALLEVGAALLHLAYDTIGVQWMGRRDPLHLLVLSSGVLALQAFMLPQSVREDALWGE